MRETITAQAQDAVQKTQAECVLEIERRMAVLREEAEARQKEAVDSAVAAEAVRWHKKSQQQEEQMAQV